MSEELIAEKLNEINSMTDIETGRPTIPVSIALQEAEDLHGWCMKDKEVLTKAGLDFTLVTDLKARAGALRQSQTNWSNEYKEYQDCQAQWKIEAPAAYNLRDELVHHFYHAFYNLQGEYAKVQRIAEGYSHADMIQDLSDLAGLGMKNTAELEAIGMDLNLLELAKTKSSELAGLLAKVNGSLRETSPKLEIRNKAYFHLKEAVDEIRRVGQYVFWRNEVRLKGYISPYLRRMNKNQKKKISEKVA